MDGTQSLTLGGPEGLKAINQRSQIYLSGATAETKYKVKRVVLLDVVVEEGAVVLELFAGEDEALVLGRYVRLVLDLGLHVEDGVVEVDVHGDRIAVERLDEDLHAAIEPWTTMPCLLKIGDSTEEVSDKTLLNILFHFEDHDFLLHRSHGLDGGDG